MSKLSDRHRATLSRRLALLGYASYADYLRGPHWREFSAANRKRTCQRAGCKARAGLHVHHVTYVRLGAELPSDVRTLCSRCHYLLHRTGGSLDPARLSALVPGKPKRRPKRGRPAQGVVSVACPTCGSCPGTSCVGADGRYRSSHDERKRAARARLSLAAKRPAAKLKRRVDERRG